MILEQEYETIPREDLEQLQVERLQSTLYRVYRYVSFYRQSFDTHGVNIETIKSVKDLAQLPFTTKEDLRKSYPYDMFAVPLRDIVRIHSTSGTTGQPIIVGYTKNDLRHWTDCTARLLAAAGVDEHDVVQIAFPFNLFTGGFGFHQGAEQIGASVIPSSTSAPEKQIMIMKDFKTSVLICAPSYAVNIASTLAELQLHAESLSLRVGLFGAEPWSENLRNQLQETLHIIALDNYGLTEVIGPGVAGECEHKNGLHVNEDHFVVEVIDPKSLESLPLGQEGELVFTTITKEGFPLIRYRTGDISSLIEESCACGRTTRRMRRVTGRTDDLIFIKGQKVFPSQIEEILLEAEGTAPHYRILLDRQEGNDTMEVQVEILESYPAFDELKNLERLRDTITKKIEVVLGVEAKVTLVEPRSLLRENGAKTRRVIDKRST
ncbi:MAG: phenylacetate--CoA ligase [Spirochaetaceae bacterium]|nr:MAG: phenylacetate--CoA ligase [Spirochaetaceae bacterium]